MVGKQYPQLIEPTRALLRQAGVPYVIENVIAAPIRKDLMLYGEMFGLRVIRHRYFEISGFPCPQPRHPKHRLPGVKGGHYACVVTGKFRNKPSLKIYNEMGLKGNTEMEQWQQAMKIDWITDLHMLAEAVPPAYSEYIGKAFLFWKEVS